MCSPVTASMRRRFEPIEPSDTTLMGPISPVACTCVPPHSSRLGPASRTRTTSPYLSPKKAMAPMAWASAIGDLHDAGGVVDEDLVVGEGLDAGDLLGGDGRVVAEVEPQAVGVDAASRPA